MQSSNDQNGFKVGQWLAKKMQGKLAADTPKLNYTTPAVITKENVDKYIKTNAVF